MKIDHVVNPVKVGSDSDLYVAQPITFRSMSKAAEQAKNAGINVKLYTISYPEDVMALPEEFEQLPALRRSVLDVAGFQGNRKLPLIEDILDAVIEESEADYIIYTNVDISVMPYFYEFVSEKIKKHDALVINRRTIGKERSADTPLHEFYSQVGKEHPGFDCFIFKKSLYEKFYLGDACIGANWIGRIIICNLMAHAESFELEKNAHLTFHLGDDRSWKTPANLEYDEFNEKVLFELMQIISDQGLLYKHDMLSRSYEEFVTKEKDPDPGRATRIDAAQASGVVLDTSKLFHQYRASNDWFEYDDNIIDQSPVFIVGYPRSGTTLLQSLVATQYTRAVFPETHFFSITRSKFSVVNDRIQADSLKATIEFIREKLVISDDLEEYIIKAVNEGILSPKMLFEVIVYDQLAVNLAVDEISDEPWIEKTPDHVYHLDVIHRYYPNAKIIFVVRNPERAILSRRKHFTWSDEANWPIEKHIDKWNKAIECAEYFKEQTPDNIHFAKFEDVVEDKDKTIRSICDFLGISFSKDALQGFKQFSDQQSLSWESWKEETKSDVSPTTANKNEFLSDDDRIKLKQLALENIEKFSYEHVFVKRSGLFSKLRSIFSE